jgi:hypothetical protein
MTNKKIKIIDAKVEDIVANEPSGSDSGKNSSVPTLETRLQKAFSNDNIKILLITDRIYDPNTFEISQGIKLEVNGAEVKMKWNVEIADKHQKATGTPSEDIVYNAVVGTLTAWGTCRMVVVE